METPSEKLIIDNLLDDLHKYYIDENRQKDPEYYGKGLHASAIGYCKKRAVLQYYKFPANIKSLQACVAMDRGTYFHERIQSSLKNSKHFEVLYENFEISGGLPQDVVGKLDIVVQDKLDQNILVDIKTASEFALRNYGSSLPKKEHIYQITLYDRGLFILTKTKIDKLLLYYCSANGDFKPVFVEREQMIDKIMYEYLKAIKDYKEVGLLPDVVDVEDSWKCNIKYCEYKNISCEGYVEDENSFGKWCDEESKGEKKQ